MNRLARAAWVSLALLSLVTLGAGATVAHLLPGRLALWRLPTVAQRPLAAGGPVLAPVPGGAEAAAGRPVGASSAGQAASAAGVTAALSPGLASAALGPHVAGLVTNLATGQVLFSRNGTGLFAPGLDCQAGRGGRRA